VYYSLTKLMSVFCVCVCTGFTKTNPINLDSDEDSDEPDTSKIEEQRDEYNTENNSVSRNTKQENQQDLNLLPSDTGQRSASPANQGFSLFKCRSIEKSLKRLNHLNNLNNSGDSSRFTVTTSSSGAQLNSLSSISSSMTTVTTHSSKTNSVKPNSPVSNSSVECGMSFSHAGNGDLSSSNGSSDDVKLIEESDDTNRALKCRSRLFDRGNVSSDDTISLDESDDHVICRKKEKRYKKKGTFGRRIKKTDLDYSDDTESLEEPVSLLQEPSSNSDIDSDEPLEKLFSTPQKAETKIPCASSAAKNSPQVSRSQTTAKNTNIITPSSVIGVDRDENQIRNRPVNIKEILKDTKSRKKTYKFSWFSNDVPQKAHGFKRNSPSVKVETPFCDLNDIKLESRQCTDDRVPRISEVRQLDKFPAIKSESATNHDDAATEISEKGSSEFPVHKREPSTLSYGRIPRKYKRKISRFPTMKLEIAKFSNSSVDTQTSEEKKGKDKDDTTVVGASIFEDNDENEIDDHSLCEIGKALENYGEFNDDDTPVEGASIFKDNDVNEIDDHSLCVIGKALENDGEFNDDDTPVEGASIFKDNDVNEIDDISLCEMSTALENDGDWDATSDDCERARNDGEEPCSTSTNMDEVEFSKDLNDEWCVSDNKKQLHNCKRAKNDDEKEPCSKLAEMDGFEYGEDVNQENYMDYEEIGTEFKIGEEYGSLASDGGSIESVGRIRKIIDQMDRKYTEISSEIEEEGEEEGEENEAEEEEEEE
jgi:hypothetical protein